MAVKLAIELVPQSAFGEKLRSALSLKDWDRVRKSTYEKAGHHCEICGGQGSRHPVECHEVWDYNDVTHTQKLVRTIALCPSCHKAKHFGFAQLKGWEAAAIVHLKKVNGWNILQVKEHIHEQAQIWQERSRHSWTLDLSWLQENFNIQI